MSPTRRAASLIVAALIAAATLPAGAAASSAAAIAASIARPAIPAPAVLAPPTRPATGAPATTPASVVSLPGIPSKWPSTNLEVGLTDSPNGAAALHASGQYKFRYQYLSGGANTGHGWSTWNSPAGQFVTYYVNESVAVGITPVFIYYQLLQSAPAGGAENTTDLAHMASPSIMNAYWADVRLMFQKLGAYSQTIVVDIEPDLWGYIEQATMSHTTDDGASIPAAVASSGDADVAGLPNNADGFAQAFIKLRDKYAPNVLLGYELSMWGTNTDPISQNIPLNQIDALAARSTAFQQSLGANFDLVFTDPSDRDADFYKIQYGNPNAAWDTTDFDRFNQYVGDFVRGTGLRMVLWQIPLGNTKMLAMNDTWGHYQDNHVEWWFDDATNTHLAAAVSSGVIAMLFGGGAGGTTCACDSDPQDGVTNPAPIDGNTTASYSADNDGGFFRHQVNAYYSAGAMALPGLTYSSSAGAASAVVMRGTNQTISASVVSQVTTTVYVDVSLFSPTGTDVADWTYDNIALTAGVGHDFAPVTWAAGASAATGSYTVRIGFYTPGGATQLAQNDRAASFTVVAAGTFVAVPPVRLLDTRKALGLKTRLASGQPQSFQVAGRGPVPANAIGVTGNLTVTGQLVAGYVTLGPTVTASPAFSTINAPARDTRANGVTVALAGDGSLAAVFVGGASTNKADLIFDVTGYFMPDLTEAAFVTVTPYRTLDTRIGTPSPLVEGTPRTFAIGNAVPSTAVAVTGNLTVVGQTAAGYVTLGPTITGSPAPTFSTINFPVGDTRANNVTVQLGPNGTLQAVYIAAARAHTHLLFDVTGYYVPGPGAAYVPLSPVRLLDTRPAPAAPLARGSIRAFSLTAGVPLGATAVSGNLTATGETSGGYLAIGPNVAYPAATSTINFPAGDTRANGVVVALGANRTLTLVSAAASMHALFDLTGYFLPIP